MFFYVDFNDLALFSFLLVNLCAFFYIAAM